LWIFCGAGKMYPRPLPPAQMQFDPYELSYSKIRSFLDCPVLYRYRYVEGKWVPPSGPSSFGLSIHKALEQYHKCRGDLAAMMDYYDCVWINAGFASPQEQAGYYDLGRKMLEVYWRNDRERRSIVLYLEKKFEFVLGKFKVRGIIDRIDSRPDGKCELIDYKTGQTERNEEYFRSSLQSAIYGIGMKRGLAIEPAIVTFWQLYQGIQHSFPYDASREEAVIETLCKTGEEILKEDFQPNTAHCAFCLIKKSCAFSVCKK